MYQNIKPTYVMIAINFYEIDFQDGKLVLVHVCTFEVEDKSENLHVCNCDSDQLMLVKSLDKTLSVLPGETLSISQPFSAMYV